MEYSTSLFYAKKYFAIHNSSFDTKFFPYLCCDLKDSMTNPDGGITSYTYDALKRVTSLTNSFGETTNYTYDNLFRVTRKDLANGSCTNYSYDAASRLTSLVNMISGGSVISSYAYSLDNIGNRSSMTTPAGTHNHSYDNIYQLLQATHPSSSTEAYTYGPVHNRLTSADHNDWTYDNNNRLVNYNGFSYTYDANGNMISKTDTALPRVTSYQYDYENKLKRIDYPDGTYSEYLYDPFGNRIKKDVNGTVTWFIYDLIKMLPDVIAEYDGNGALVAGYTHGPGIDDVVSMRRGGDSYYYFKDALGSIRSLSDSSETTVNNYEYDAFGSVFSKTELVVNPYGFTGRVLDNESGLMYYRMRYYDPGIGRFITADPIRFQGGINFYTYVLNNPISFVDPFGLNALCKAICSAGKFIDIHYCNVTASWVHEQECKELFARSPRNCFRRVERWRKDCIKGAEKKFKDCIENCEEEEACP